MGFLRFFNDLEFSLLIEPKSEWSILWHGDVLGRFKGRLECGKYCEVCKSFDSNEQKIDRIAHTFGFLLVGLPLTATNGGNTSVRVVIVTLWREMRYGTT